MPTTIDAKNGGRRRMSKSDRVAARGKTARDFSGTLSERAGRAVIHRLRDKALNGADDD